MFYIYGLIDPTTHKISYIGHTIHPYNRLDEHIDEAAKTIKGEWIRRLRAAGIHPTIVILDSFEDGPVSDIERWWVEFGRRAGWPLTNTLYIKSDRYNMQTLPIGGEIDGFWDDGEWISAATWYNLPSGISTDDLGFAYNMDNPNDMAEMKKRKALHDAEQERLAIAETERKRLEDTRRQVETDADADWYALPDNTEANQEWE